MATGFTVPTTDHVSAQPALTPIDATNECYGGARSNAIRENPGVNTMPITTSSESCPSGDEMDEEQEPKEVLMPSDDFDTAIAALAASATTEPVIEAISDRVVSTSNDSANLYCDSESSGADIMHEERELQLVQQVSLLSFGDACAVLSAIREDEYEDQISGQAHPNVGNDEPISIDLAVRLQLYEVISTREDAQANANTNNSARGSRSALSPSETMQSQREPGELCLELRDEHSQEELTMFQVYAQANDGARTLAQAMYTESVALLDDAIRAIYPAANRLPERHPSLLDVLSNLGVAFHLRSGWSELDNANDLEEAISLQTRAVNLTPDGHPNKPIVISNLGRAFQVRFRRLGEISDLEEAISLHTRAINLTSDRNFDKPRQLDNLGSALGIRFQCLDKISDLEGAISLQTRAVDLTPDGHSNKPCLLSNLGDTFLRCFERFGKISDLEEAISLQARAARLTPDEHPHKPGLLGSLGNALEKRFDRLSEIGDLEEAISLQTRAVAFTPDGHPNKPHLLGNLGKAFRIRFECLDNAGDLEKAISMQTRAAELIPDKDLNKPRLLSSLGITFRLCFERLGNASDLDEAISVQTHAVKLTPDGHPHKPGWLSNLGDTLKVRFEHLYKLDDLDKAIFMQAHAVELTPAGHPNKPSRLSSLGNALEMRFKCLGEISDLEDAISLEIKATNLTPDQHPDKPRQLDNLGNALLTRFTRLGDISDLEEAISRQTHAADLILDEHPDKRGLLGNLGGAFMKRFYHLGETDDLEKAISHKAHAVTLTADKHPDKPVWLDGLRMAIHSRFEKLGSIDDLKYAVSLGTRAIELIPDGHSKRPFLLSNTGYTLLARFRHLGEISDLNRSISLFTDSANLTDDVRPEKSTVLISLGSALHLRFVRLHKIDDLEQAIFNSRRAVKLSPSNDPRLTISLLSLAQFLQLYFNRTAHPTGHCTEAIECLKTAVTHGTSFPHDRLEAAKFLAKIYWTPSHYNNTILYNELVRTYEHAMGLIPEVVWLGSSITRRYELLVGVAAITSGAAAAAIAIEKFTCAVGWMEQGRGVVWSQLLQLRSPVDDLSISHPGLAQQLRFISRQLEQSANMTEDFVDENQGQDGDTTQEDRSSMRIRLAREYQGLLSKIRTLEGFEDFLGVKKYADIVPACGDGPVVLINTHKSSCDALICLSVDRIIHVPLHGINLEFCQVMREQFISPVRSSSRYRHKSADFLYLADRGTTRIQSDPLITALCALWEQVVLPILQAIEGELCTRVADDLPHITWCTTGPLAFLPIHAAGDYLTPGGTKIYDRVVSSYTPTISSLLRPPTHPFRSRPSSPKILTISQPQSSKYPALPGTIKEMDKLESRFSKANVIHLSGSEATVDAVLEAMGRHDPCPYIHLACHGVQNPNDPRKSAFELHDGPLELGRLMSKVSNNATLAFLSACQTATGDVKLTEESVYLAAGMLAVGYQGVIGTMWSIHDSDAPDVADDFYRVLMERQAAEEQGVVGRSRIHAAYALHEATKKLRETVGESNIRCTYLFTSAFVQYWNARLTAILCGIAALYVLLCSHGSRIASDSIRNATTVIFSYTYLFTFLSFSTTSICAGTL